MDEKVPKHTSDGLVEIFGDVLDQLSLDQMRFVIRRQNCSSDKEAAEGIEVSPSTVKGWKQKGIPIDDAVDLMASNGMVVALHLRRRNLGKAMAVKAAGLDSDDERVRQSTATEIIEWELGKAMQPQKLKQEGAIDVNIKNEGSDRAISTLADALSDIIHRGSADGEESPPLDSPE